MRTAGVKIWTLEYKNTKDNFLKQAKNQAKGEENHIYLAEQPGSLSQALDIGGERLSEKISLCRKRNIPYVISLVGAGGKTTVMYQMAKELAGEGWKVAVTTSTHIFIPEEGIPVLFLPEEKNFEKRIEEAEIKAEEEKNFLVSGVICIQTEGENKKLSSLPEELFGRLEGWADILLIEADGSKHLPLKIPAPWEPVILPETSLVIGCVGLSSLGKPWREICFRSEYGHRFFVGDVVTEESVAGILTDEQAMKKSVGTREYRIVLNQADSQEDRKKGEKILRMTQGICDGGICTSFL